MPARTKRGTAPNGRRNPEDAKPFPVATVLLSALLVISYFALSKGAYYLSDEAISGLALALSQFPLGLVSYLFVHIGLVHLAGNLLGLAAFCYLVETRLSSKDALAVFFLSGAVGGIVFFLANPLVQLAGASAGIAGLMAAAVLADLKRTAASLVAVPLLVQFAIAPSLDSLASSKEAALAGQAEQKQAEVARYLAKNMTAEASRATGELESAQTQLEVHREGIVREETTESDWLVHLAGAFVGAGYVVSFRRGAFMNTVRQARTLRKRFLYSGLGK